MFRKKDAINAVSNEKTLVSESQSAHLSRTNSASSATASAAGGGGGSKTIVPSAEDYQIFIDFVRERFKTHPYLTSFSDGDLKRFLLAHKNNSLQAAKQLQITLDWRSAINFNSILTEDFSDLEATGKLTIDCTDMHQNAVLIWQQHRHTPLHTPKTNNTTPQTPHSTPNISQPAAVFSSNPPQPSSTFTTPQSTPLTTTKQLHQNHHHHHTKKEEKEALQTCMDRNLRFFIYTIERAKQTHRLRLDNKLTIIIDRLQMTPRNHDQPLGKAILAILQHYPDLFDACFVFPRNAVLMVAWKVTKVFLDPATAGRIRMLTEGEVQGALKEVIAREELLKRYGGDKEDFVKDDGGGSGSVVVVGCDAKDGVPGVEAGDLVDGDLVVDDLEEDDDAAFVMAEGEEEEAKA